MKGSYEILDGVPPRWVGFGNFPIACTPCSHLDSMRSRSTAPHMTYPQTYDIEQKIAAHIGYSICTEDLTIGATI